MSWSQLSYLPRISWAPGLLSPCQGPSNFAGSLWWHMMAWEMPHYISSYSQTYSHSAVQCLYGQVLRISHVKVVFGKWSRHWKCPQVKTPQSKEARLETSKTSEGYRKWVNAKRVKPLGLFSLKKRMKWVTLLLFKCKKDSYAEAVSRCMNISLLWTEEETMAFS